MPRAAAPPAPAPTGRRDLLGLLAVLLLGAIAYSNAPQAGFVFDDLGQIVENPGVQGLAAFGRSTHLPNRWVGYLSFALSHEAFGLAPAGWHAVNVAIHLANAALVWTLVLLAFRTPRLRTSVLAPASSSLAFAAAALCVVHPLATQAVTYVVQRLTSLATLSYLAASVLFVAWRLAEGRRGRGWMYAGSLLAAFLAVRTKEIAFTLPLTLLMVEWALFAGGRRRFLAVVPVAGLALLIPLSLLDLGGHGGSVLASADASTRVMAPAGRLDYLRTQAVVVVRYLAMLALPAGQAVDHHVAIRRSWLAPDVAGATILLAAIASLGGWLAWRSTPRRGRPPLDPAVRLVALGIGWFFVTLSVESSLIPIADVMNEHRVYLPSVGILLALVTGGALGLRRVDPVHYPRDLAIAAGVASMVLGGVTWSRNRVWMDEVSLWSDAAAKEPRMIRPLSNWGAALTKQQRYREAAAVFARAVELEPSSVAAHVQLGVVRYLSGDVRGAEVALRRAVALDPDDPDALLNFSVFLGATGRRPEARIHLDRLRQVARDPADRAWAEAELAK